MRNKKIKFGRFEYPKNFEYRVDGNPIFGYIKNNKIFNCAENSDGDAVCGNVEFTNINVDEVLLSVGPNYLRNNVPVLINWWDCRINKENPTCCN